MRLRYTHPSRSVTTAPYFHDGSAETLREVVDRLPFSVDLPDTDKADLVEYVQLL